MESFMVKSDGPLIGLRQSSQWDALVDTLAEQAPAPWYVYQVGEEPPVSPATPQQLEALLWDIGELLRRDHDQPHLGIVYVDDLWRPSFIKVHDPNNLRAACGTSSVRVLPGWILSRIAPRKSPTMAATVIPLVDNHAAVRFAPRPAASIMLRAIRPKAQDAVSAVQDARARSLFRPSLLSQRL
jgi:hypothetical protein